MIVTAVLLLVTLAVAYALSRKWRVKSKRYLWFLFLAAAVLAAAALIYTYTSDFMRVDACLDGGGRWNYESRVCEK